MLSWRLACDLVFLSLRVRPLVFWCCLRRCRSTFARNESSSIIEASFSVCTQASAGNALTVYNWAIEYPFLSKCPEHLRPSISNRMFSIVES